MTLWGSFHPYFLWSYVVMCFFRVFIKKNKICVDQYWSDFSWKQLFSQCSQNSLAQELEHLPRMWETQIQFPPSFDSNHYLPPRLCRPGLTNTFPHDLWGPILTRLCVLSDFFMGHLREASGQIYSLQSLGDWDDDACSLLCCPKATLHIAVKRRTQGNRVIHLVRNLSEPILSKWICW